MQVNSIRELSVVVFGNKHRLELLAELVRAPQPGLCAADLSRRLDVPASVLTPQMRALERVRLVRRTGPGRGRDRRVFYAIEPSPLWTGLAKLTEELGLNDSGAEALS